jgi:hypothetical protein
MNRNALVVVALCAGLTGCVPENTQPTLTQVERRVATLVGDNEGGAAEAKCVGTEARAFRCEVSVNGLSSTYDAHLKGERIELDKS